MENKSFNSELSKNSNSSRLLKILVYLAGMAEVIFILPYFNSDSIDFFESISPIGDIIATLIEVVFLCLVANKVNKEDLPISSKYIIAYAAISFITLFGPLFSEAFEMVLAVLMLVSSVIVGINFIKLKQTRNIGLFQIASVVCFFLLALYSDELLGIKDKGIIKIFLLASIAPFILYLGSCWEFLYGNNEEE